MATCDESDSTSLPRQIYVPKTTMEMSVTMLVDHMHFFVLDRVVSLIPLDSTERVFHGRHDKRLCFWLQSAHQVDMSERFGDIFDEHGCVIQSKFLNATNSMSDILCQICHQHTAPTFNGLVPQLQHHSYVLLSHPVDM